jgi:hypothetical protein
MIYLCVGFASSRLRLSPHLGTKQMNSASSLTPYQPVADVPFVDRRQQPGKGERGERRQFGNSYHNLSADGQQLAEAIDAYKVDNHRRYITTDELLSVLGKLGYKRSE